VNANELAWLSGFIAGHFVLGFIIADYLKEGWLASGGFVWPVGASVLANVILAIHYIGVAKDITVVLFTAFYALIFTAIGFAPSIVGFYVGVHFRR
jgi:hypothetical protein